LRKHLPAAWTGWTYIEANIPANDQARRDCVQRLPQLALGIIVRDEDFERALRTGQVVTGGIIDARSCWPLRRALHAEPATTGIVLGPSSDAYFDRPAAQNELFRRRARLDDSGHRLDVTGRQREELEDLLSRLRAFGVSSPRVGSLRKKRSSKKNRSWPKLPNAAPPDSPMNLGSCGGSRPFGR